MKILKSKKALSPVVASIILIAVTVAVSIAVAAWMGALSLSFMATEQIAFTDFRWDTDLEHCNMTIKNTGTAVLTIATVKVNNVLNSTGPGWDPYESNTEATLDWALITLDANEEVVIQIDPTKYFGVDTYFTRGGSYAFTVVTTKNNPFGPYTVSAPS